MVIVATTAIVLLVVTLMLPVVEVHNLKIHETMYIQLPTRTSTRQTQGYGGGDTDSTLDLNAIPSHQMFDNKKPIKRNQQSSQQPANDYNLDLNDEYGEEEDLNLILVKYLKNNNKLILKMKK